METIEEIQSRINGSEIVLVSALESLGFCGVDVDMGISLLEYGIAWLQRDDKYLFVYGVSYDERLHEYESFDTNIKLESKFDSDFSWVDREDIRSFCDKFDSLDYPDKVDTIRHYYGHINTFGESTDRLMVFDTTPVRGLAFLSHEDPNVIMFEQKPGNETFRMIGFDGEVQDGVTAEIFAVIRGKHAYFWGEVE